MSAYACVDRIFTHCTLSVSTEYLWGDLKAVCLFSLRCSCYLPKSSFSHLLHSFFPTFSLRLLQKTEMEPSVGRLRKSSVGPKRQERSQGRERRLCDVTGKVIKGQSVGRSGKKGGGEWERLWGLLRIFCICYFITWKALKVTDYHKGKLFPSHFDPGM